MPEPTDWSLMLDLVILLAAALALGAVSERLKQNALIGYLIAGMLVGPNVLAWVGRESQEDVEVLAELGVALLLFTIGLEFSFRRLRQLGPAALLGGVFQVVATIIVAGAIAAALGASVKVAAAIGGIIALSSTACVLKVLISRAELESVHGRTALGILLFQDIAMVPLVLIVEMLTDEGTFGAIMWETAKALAIAAVLIAIFFGLFNYFVPWLLGRQFVARNRELPILLAAVTAIGATWAAHEADLSPALGAFVAGVLLGGSPFAVQIRADMSSLRTLLVTLFFSAVGMFADPVWIAKHLPAVLGLALAIIIGKALIVWPIALRFRRTHAQSITTGLTLGQVGEFSFVLAGAAYPALLSDDLFLLLVSATIVTLILTPYVMLFAPRVGAVVQGLIRPEGPRAAPTTDQEAIAHPPQPGVVIVGFGPAGQAVANSLSGKDLPVSVIDLNPRIPAEARRFGFAGHVGDASHPDVLEHAHMARAEVLVITLPDPAMVRQIIQQTRANWPHVRIVARARYHVHAWSLRYAGADVVVDEEEQVGLRLAAEMRKQVRTLEKEEHGHVESVADALGEPSGGD
jgi:CPA2 family monovalent cation:H+ antiporter-2